MIVKDAAELRIFLFVVLLQTFAYFIPPSTWNPVSRFGLTHAIVEHGRLDIDAFALATGDRARRRGRWYTDKAPFASFAAVPIYALVRAVHRLEGRPPPGFVAEDRRGIVAATLTPNATMTQLLYVSSVATSGVAGAALGVLLYVLVRRRFDARTSLFATLACVLGTPIFPYATSLYGHVPAAVMLVGALVVSDEDPRDVRRWALLGVLLASAAGFEYITAAPAAVIGGAALVRARGRRLHAALGMALGALMPAACVLAYQAACFGAPGRTGYSFLVDTRFAEGHARGVLGLTRPSVDALYGIFLGARRGLVRHWPVAAVGFVGLVAYIRGHRKDTTAITGAVAFAVLTLANAAYYMWWGGAASGPRHLVPMLPVLAIGIAEAWSRAHARAPTALLALFAVLVSLGLALVGIEVIEHGDAVRDYLLPRLAAGEIATRRGASNLGVLIGFPRMGSFGPLVAFFVVAAHALWEGARREDDAAA